MIWPQWFICDCLDSTNTSEQDIKKFISCQNNISYLYSKQVCIHVVFSGALSSYSSWIWVLCGTRKSDGSFGILSAIVHTPSEVIIHCATVVPMEMKMMSMRTVLASGAQGFMRVWDLVSSHPWLAKTKETNWEADPFTPETFVH